VLARSTFSDGGGREHGTARSIDHIVVLMLENRSFDHMLGYLYRTPARSLLAATRSRG